jgi:hypothetical protein
MCAMRASELSGWGMKVCVVDEWVSARKGDMDHLHPSNRRAGGSILYVV